MGYHGYVVERLAQFGLCDKVISYVKDKGANLNTLTIAMTSVVSYTSFMLTMPYFATCYGHALSRCCQYVANDSKVCWNERTIISSSKNHYMDKKKGAKNLQRCIFLPLEIEIFYQDSICIQSHSFQINFGIQGCHQSMIFAKNHYLAKQNS
jgi:hypothetical protein